MGAIRDFKDLRIWMMGMEIVRNVYSATASFPKSELFGLTNQMRRASISIPSNIAEGHIKNQTNEFARYLTISIGSCAELETQVMIARDLGWIDKERFEILIDLIKSETKQINALRKRLTGY